MSDTSAQIFDDQQSPNLVTPRFPPSTPTPERHLRLWPGVAIVALQWTAITVIGWLFPATPTQFMAMFLGPMIGGGAVFLWWIFLSRLPWMDRVLVPVAFLLFGSAILVAGHESIGMFGILMQGIPAALTAWMIWLVVSFPLRWPVRRVGLLIVLMLTWSYFTLIRMDGIWGRMAADLNWRWTPTTEQQFLAERTVPVHAVIEAKPLTLASGDWPCFRGPNRDNRLIGVKIATDWNAHPPKLLWKHKVGPGWGSFAVVGNHVFTQEQWDKKEAVVCYDSDNGKILWFHEYPARFTEVVAGPGPRATPTFHEGKIYALGAAGNLFCLDAASGKEIWSTDILADSGAKVPQWGFASSPLIVQGIVTVFAGGPNKSVVGYDAATGKLAWAAGEGELSYCSLQRAVIDGVEQVMLATGDGLTSFSPTDGKVLWDHKWLIEGGARVVQPAAVGPNDFLVGTGFGNGTRRLRITQSGDNWDQKEIWTTRAFNPYFNDFVIQKDHLFGFNNDVFCCVQLDKGKAKWKERGYGCGQVLLLADQELLLLLSEKGEIALVEANSTEHKELARMQAIEGKTWNHPVLAHGRLYVRNGIEAACYHLAELKAESIGD